MTLLINCMYSANLIYSRRLIITIPSVFPRKSWNFIYYILSQARYVISGQNNEDESDFTIGLCFWTIFQAVGLACVATIIYRSVIYRQGYFKVPSDYSDLIFITSVQCSNWHYSLTTIGFIYLYANCKFCNEYYIYI